MQMVIPLSITTVQLKKRVEIPQPDLCVSYSESEYQFSVAFLKWDQQ